MSMDWWDITPEIKAQIIGLWRQGNDSAVIALLTGTDANDVDKIIREYKKEKE